MTISTVDYELPDTTHNLYDVTFFNDQIHTLVTNTPSMVDSWIAETECIHPHTQRFIVGLDVEWRPNRHRNSDYPVATIQLCVDRRCLIFQPLHAPRIPQSLIDFLSNGNYCFVGAGINEDVEKLLLDYSLGVANTVDLRVLAVDKLGRTELRGAGLKTLAKEILGKEIQKPKSVSTSRWDNEWLTPAQVQYACIDAFLSSEIGRRLTATS